MTNFNAPTISSSAMLCEVSIGQWTARRRDKAATEDLLRQNNAAKGAGGFTKNLLAGCVELEAIQKFVARVRSTHLYMTMPWCDTGPRLVTTRQYFKHVEAMTGFRAEFEKLVSSLCEVYDAMVTQAQTTLGHLHVQSEYPSVSEVRRKFHFTVNYMPVPETGDWRVDLENEAQKELQEQYASFYTKQIEAAVGSLVGRLQTELERLIRQLHVTSDGAAGKVYDGTIEHVRNLASMLEDANLTNDPTIAETSRYLQSMLAGVVKDDLVDNPRFRADTRAKLDEALRALPSLGGDWEE